MRGAIENRDRRSAYDRFVRVLMDATAAVPQHYFQMPVSYQEAPIYRERVYCYELYHQIRVRLEQSGDLRSLVLGGEVDKEGHQIIRPQVGPIKPDLLFHLPGNGDFNIAAVEVKPACRCNSVYEDFEKLVRLLTMNEMPYEGAVLLIYGDDPSVDAEVSRLAVAAEVYAGRLQVLEHRRAGEAAVPASTVVDLPWRPTDGA